MDTVYTAMPQVRLIQDRTGKEYRLTRTSEYLEVRNRTGTTLREIVYQGDPEEAERYAVLLALFLA
jgi:hypothetical protein